MPTGDDRADELLRHEVARLVRSERRLLRFALVVSPLVVSATVWQVLSSDEVVWSQLIGVVGLVSFCAFFMVLTRASVRQMSALAMELDVTVNRRSTHLADRASSTPARPTSPTHRSFHHLFGERERILPKPEDAPVAIAVDAADLPEGVLPYLVLLARNDIEARVLLLDPDSPLVSRHRFAAAEGSGDARSATENTRAKMRKAIVAMLPHAKVRLYDAMPLGNLVIVGNRIFWGGIPSVPTDVSLPVVELDADINGDLYWSYRRNFDRLWDAAKPVDALIEPSPKITSQAAG